MSNNEESHQSNEQDSSAPELRAGSDLNRSKVGRGVGIFIGLNAVMYLFSLAADDFNVTFFIGWAAMLINIIVLILLARYRRGEAGGMLGAFVVLILLTFIIGPIFWLTQCFIGIEW